VSLGWSVVVARVGGMGGRWHRERESGRQRGRGRGRSNYFSVA